MTTPNLTETAALKPCHLCIAEVPVSDNFCRRCGVRQGAHPARAAKWQEFETRRLPSEATIYQSLSSPLVNHLTQAVADRAPALGGNPSGTRVVAALTAVPIWLLIILLSPLDAYAAARTVSRQINYQ